MNANDMNTSLTVIFQMLVQAKAKLPEHIHLQQHIENHLIDLIEVQAELARRQPIDTHA